ncbi:MAG: U32 family peptidase [Lachnospiraceae bacterium]|nr:U32 family peptidase [Lachnospiraceae bacterium]
MQKNIYWHLPGFCYFRSLNQILINLMKDYPDKFRDGYKIGSVYGTFPGAIWNGGRVVFGLTPKRDMENILKIYNQHNIPVRFTWTNSLIEEKHLNDTYCNLIMKLADNGLNQVLVNTQVLEDYLRKEYPAFPVISSTTKRITDAQSLKEELEKDYHLVVLDYDLNHDMQMLQEIQPHAKRVEILVNEVCYPGCTMRKEHYRQQSQLQLEYDIHTPFACPNKATPRKFEECMSRPSFISCDQIQEYSEMGYVNFKIAGRGMPIDYVKDSYLYFLVKEEHRNFIREKMDTILRQMQAHAQATKQNVRK